RSTADTPTMRSRARQRHWRTSPMHTLCWIAHRPQRQHRTKAFLNMVIPRFALAGKAAGGTPAPCPLPPIAATSLSEMSLHQLLDVLELVEGQRVERLAVDGLGVLHRQGIRLLLVRGRQVLVPVHAVQAEGRRERAQDSDDRPHGITPSCFSKRGKVK